MQINKHEMQYVFVVNDFFQHGGHVKSFLAQFDSLRGELEQFLIVCAVGGFIFENRERLDIPERSIILIEQRRLRVWRFSLRLFLTLRRIGATGCIFHVYSDECYFSASLAKAFCKNVALVHSVMGGPSPFPVLRSTDLYVAVAPEQIRLVAKQYYAEGIPEGANFVVIKNRILPQNEAGGVVSDDIAENYVLVVTRFDPDKIVTLDRLKSILLELPRDIDVVIAGKGALESEYREALRLRENIRFVGFRRDISAFYKNACVVLGMGRSILEPMMQGVPAILVGFDGIDTLDSLESVAFASERNFAGREVYEHATVEKAAHRVVECSLARPQLFKNVLDYLNGEYRADLFRYKYFAALCDTEARSINLMLAVKEYWDYSVKRFGRICKRFLTRVMLTS